MHRLLSRVPAAAGIVLVLGATSALAGQHGPGWPSVVEFRRPQAGPPSPMHDGMSRPPSFARGFRTSPGYDGGRHGGPVVAYPYGTGQHPGFRQAGGAYGESPSRMGLGDWRMGQRMGTRSVGDGRRAPRYGYGYGTGALMGGAAGYAAGRGYPDGLHTRGDRRAAPLTVRYGERRFARSFGTAGYGYGSAGYGYGGDFGPAYTTGYDDNQTIGYATGDGTYGGQGYGGAGYVTQGYGGTGYAGHGYAGAGYAGQGYDSRGNDGASYGYGGGWSPAIPPAGGLAVYSPGAYGPGPRIVTIPSHYTPGSANPLGCTCSSGY